MTSKASALRKIRFRKAFFAPGKDRHFLLIDAGCTGAGAASARSFGALPCISWRIA